MALALAVVGDAPGAALVSGLQQIAAGLGLGEERRLLVEHGIFVRDEFEVLCPHYLEQLVRLGPQGRLELEVADATVPAFRLAVGRQIDERVTRNALVTDRARQTT